MNIPYGFRAEKSFYPSPVAQTIESKAPANSNENDDPEVGQFEYWARSAIRDLVQVKGYDNARAHVAMILNDLAEGQRS